MKILQKPKPVRSGFTLVELLIVIAIIAVLSLLVFLGARRGLMAANQSRTASQMREIGVAVAAWASENNNNEPMYFRDGTGDSSSEATPAPQGIYRNICAGNPAILLYNKANPQQGYIQDHTVFFAATQIWKAPSANDYDPSKASSTNLWGTFMWVYPSVPADERSERQKTVMRSSNYVTVSRQAYDNALMFNDYSFAARKYPQDKSYFVLFRDSTVRKVATNGDIWGWFRGGQ
jgi:prepilin-type N-terminal cleavage/methylation domain-containing protein